MLGQGLPLELGGHPKELSRKGRYVLASCLAQQTVLVLTMLAMTWCPHHFGPHGTATMLTSPSLGSSHRTCAT